MKDIDLDLPASITSIASNYVIYLVKGKDIRHLDLNEVEKDILS
jgi:hypothetical protein